MCYVPLMVMSCCALAALLITAEADYRSDPRLTRAWELYMSFAHDEATALLEEILRDTATSAAARAQAFLYAGLVSFSAGDPAEAESDFASALRLEPHLELPAEVSPKVHALIAEVRARLSHEELAAHQLTEVPGLPPASAGAESFGAAPITAVVPAPAIAAPPAEAATPSWSSYLAGGGSALSLAASVALGIASWRHGRQAHEAYWADRAYRLNSLSDREALASVSLAVCGALLGGVAVMLHVTSSAPGSGHDAGGGS